LFWSGGPETLAFLLPGSAIRVSIGPRKPEHVLSGGTNRVQTNTCKIKDKKEKTKQAKSPLRVVIALTAPVRQLFFFSFSVGFSLFTIGEFGFEPLTAFTSR
jgi:hypothetical protein